MNNQTKIDRLKTALGDLLQQILEDVPAERMSKHLITAIEDAQNLLSELTE